MLESIKNKLNIDKIKMLQLDPFSYCNARCWFCTVKYQELPMQARTHMSVDLLEKIFANIAAEKTRKNGLFDPDFGFYYTAHYNEILLYKYFEDMLRISRDYGLRTMILSNGTTLTPERTDLIKSYSDVVAGICLNVPAFERDLWATRSGMDTRLFDRLIANIKYAEEQLTYLNGNMSIQINGVDQTSFDSRLEAGLEFNSLNINVDNQSGELEQQFQLAQQLFPGLRVFKQAGLIDRAGTISHLISNKKFLENRFQNGKKVTGCTNMGDRTTNWLHVNAQGHVFVCCNDYNYEYEFGDLTNQTIRDVWLSDRHAEVIDRAFKNICTNCASAKIE
jgi:radical SAM protein with 4Fe4S-binding SPASM domain